MDLRCLYVHLLENFKQNQFSQSKKKIPIERVLVPHMHLYHSLRTTDVVYNWTTFDITYKSSILKK